MEITVVPYAGLCNRLNAIISALAYKENHPDVNLRILWYKYWHCNCRFRDLFKQLPFPYTPVQELITQFSAIPGHRFNLNIPQHLRSLWYDVSILPGTSALDFNRIVRGGHKIYVYHDNNFCVEPFPHSLSDIFHPTDELQHRINQVTDNWNDSVVGIHIRRTDNREAINLSPLSHFYDVINKEIDSDASTRFYIASDDEQVKSNLISRYGERIITIPICLTRNSIQGMKDAVVDLYCLGSTKKIYGSAHSTYSTFAAQLNNKEIII